MISKVIISSGNDKVFNCFQRQLKDFFGESIDIFNGLDPVTLTEAETILTSSWALIPNEIFKTHKVILAKRTIDIACLERLVQLPPRIRCVVAGNALESALLTINILRTLGLDFDMIPYSFDDPSSMPANARVLITPFAIPVPHTIETVIVTGIRPMDISTIVELGVHLDLPLDEANLLTARYAEHIVRLSQKLSDGLHRVNILNQELGAIINGVNDGIIKINNESKITHVNSTVCKIFGLSRDEFVGQEISSTLRGLKLNKRESPVRDLLQTINDIQVVVSKFPINSSGEINGFVLVFQEVSRLQQVEHNVRREYVKNGLSTHYSMHQLIGQSSPIKKLRDVIRKISGTSYPVFISGESGTGKELIAQTIHNLSDRKNSVFVPINLAGLPETLAESELFGYEEGAFTGGRRGGQSGLFELAHNGTIFLDEIGDASPRIQGLLLRVLQEREVMRIGGRKMIPVNVRVIAATNKDLHNLVREGRFREDLYYRLRVLSVSVPALRDRREDIPLLVEHIKKQFSFAEALVEPQVMKVLMNHTWPGNVRELVAVLQHMWTFREGPIISEEHLPPEFIESAQSVGGPSHMPALIELEPREDFRLILGVLYSSFQRGELVGRASILESVAQAGVVLTESKVRRYLGILQRYGYVVSGNRRQGTQITRSGRQLLDLLIESCAN